MPREKGDIPIKNMPDVKDLGAELENSLEGFAKMDEAAQKVVQSVGGITDNLAKSNKWSAKNKKEAKRLLEESDWVGLADVREKLSNLNDWDTYRTSLRDFIISPKKDDLPIKPKTVTWKE